MIARNIVQIDVSTSTVPGVAGFVFVELSGLFARVGMLSIGCRSAGIIGVKDEELQGSHSKN